MASDVTIDTSGWGRARFIVSVTSQSKANNTSTLRVRAILYNDDTGNPRNSSVSWSISGKASRSGTDALNVAPKGSQTFIDESFVIKHSSDGSLGTCTFTVNIGETGTSTFGNPAAKSVDINPPNHKFSPDKMATPSGSFIEPDKVKISWVPPDDNGSTITSYRIRYDDNSAMSSPTYVSAGSGSARSKEISGLTRGKTWYFQTEATSAAGSSDWSASRAVTLPGLPTETRDLKVSFTPKQAANLSWTAPSYIGTAITEYQIEHSANSDLSGATVVSAGTSTKYTYTQAMGTTRYFRVRAKNSGGWGGWSNVVSLFVPNIPSAPRDVVATKNPPYSIDVSWAAPTSNGGAAIIDYIVQARPTNGTALDPVRVTGLSATLSGLTPGLTYEISVVATNTQGSSPAASPASNVLINSGPMIFDGGVWKNTVTYVNANGTWKIAIPYVNVNGVWKVAGG